MSPSAPERAVATLAASAESTEQCFLGVGHSLEAAVAILERLNGRFATYVAELTDDRLGFAGDGLAAASRQVAQLAQAHDADTAALQVLGQIVAAISHRVTALQPITREIETLAGSARIVAGGMGDAGSDFFSFTASIRRAVDGARGSLDHVRQDIRRADEDLDAARQGAATLWDRHGLAIRTIPGRLAANQETLAKRRHLAGDAAAIARERAESVGRRVAEQIVALQLGDATRQRLEHVAFGARLLAAMPGPCDLVSRVLVAQLRDSADQLQAEGGQIEHGLAQLSNNARAIGALGAAVRAEGEGGDDSFVATLEADLRQTATLFAELRAADAATEQRMRSVLEAATDLAGRLADVQSVEQDIRIIGLNAALKCGRLGTGGRALAVVAQELRACGGRFAGEAAAVLAELGRLRSQAGGLLDPARAARHSGLAEAAEGMLSAVHDLQRLECGLREGLVQLQADAAEVGDLVQAALDRFAVCREVATQIRQAADALSAPPGDVAIGDVATGDVATGDVATGDVAPGKAATEVSESRAWEALEQIAATYTMAREREVHAALAPLPALAAVGEASGADEFLL